MTTLVFSVYDSKAEAYQRPWTANTVGLAERAFSDMVNHQGSDFHNHPEDYTLYLIGQFDTHNAELVATKHTALANGLTLVKSTETAAALPWESN